MGFVKDNGYTLQDGLDSVGFGWASLVREAFANLPERARIVQVKEKFGGLRIYVDFSTVEYQGLLDEIETRSLATCESCGDPGSLDSSTYWMLTLCERHKAERAARLAAR